MSTPVEPVNPVLDAVLGVRPKITGSGPTALVTLFEYLAALLRGIGGLPAFYMMTPTEAAEFLMKDFVCEDPELYRVLHEFCFTRCPLEDIECIVKDINADINEQWVNCAPGHLFTPCFMNLDHLVPKYYQLYARTLSPPAREVTAAWLTDLSHGIYITCRGMIEGLIGVNPDEDADEALAKFIMNADLRDAFMAIPETMRYKAHVHGVAIALSRYN